MVYRLKERLWSLGKAFAIEDEEGNTAFEVTGKVFSWGEKLAMRDRRGKKVASISQKKLSFKPHYEIYRRGDFFAEVTKEFSWLKRRFTLDVPGPNDYSITGSFWSHEYRFERGGQQVAHVSKDLWSWSDAYGVDIVDGEDDIVILATAVVIDLVCYGDDTC